MATKTELPDVLEIEVTAEDIAKGIKRSVFSCPVARAVRRVTRVRILEISSAIYLGRWPHQQYKLPHEVNRKISKLDEGKGMEPFKFTAKRIK